MSAPIVTVSWTALKSLAYNDGENMKYDAISEDSGSQHYVVFVQDGASFYQTELRENESNFVTADLTDFVDNYKTLANKITGAQVGNIDVSATAVVGTYPVDAAGLRLPAGLCNTYSSATLKLVKVDQEILFSNAGWTSLYSRSGSGVWLSGGLSFDTDETLIRVLIDGTDEMCGAAGAGAMKFKDVGWMEETGKFHIAATFMSAYKTKVGFDFIKGCAAGLKYNTSMQILVKRDATATGTKKFLRLRLWEVRLS